MKLGSLHFVALLLVSVSALVDIRLPALFSDHMVAQRDSPYQSGVGLLQGRPSLCLWQVCRQQPPWRLTVPGTYGWEH